MIFQGKKGESMAGPFIDFDDGGLSLPLSDNLAIDSEGHTLLRMSENMALDADTGDVHLISGWTTDGEE